MIFYTVQEFESKLDSDPSKLLDTITNEEVIVILREGKPAYLAIDISDDNIYKAYKEVQKLKGIIDTDSAS